MVDNMAGEGFLHPEYSAMLTFHAELAAILEAFQLYSPPLPKWQTVSKVPQSVIRVVTALVHDEAGRVLLVRKRGTRAFMQPGGTLRDSESHQAALERELKEELGCSIRPGGAAFIGTFLAPAANETGCGVQAALYRVEVDGPVTAAAEIEEIAWIDPEPPHLLELAPLTQHRSCHSRRARVPPPAKAVHSREVSRSSLHYLRLRRGYGDAMNGRQQFIPAHRFRKVTVHSRFQASLVVSFDRVGSQRKNRDAPAGLLLDRADGGGTLKTIQVRHLDVHEDQIEWLFTPCGQSLAAVARDRHFVPRLLQQPGCDFLIDEVVLRNQHPERRCFRCRCHHIRSFECGRINGLRQRNDKMKPAPLSDFTFHPDIPAH